MLVTMILLLSAPTLPLRSQVYDRELNTRHIFQIYADTVAGVRTYRYWTTTFGNRVRVVAHRMLSSHLPGFWKRRRAPMLMEVSMYPPDQFRPTTFSDYDSTIVRFDGEQVIPVRPGRTAVTIAYHTGFTGEALVEVDRSMVVRVVEPEDQ